VLSTVRPHLAGLGKFHTTGELETSELYQRFQTDIETVLASVITGACLPPPKESARPIQAVAWNIERGIHTDEIIEALIRNAGLKSCDVLMLSEVDWGMARTRNRFVARDIALALNLNYAFAPCYIALNKGSGIEKNAVGENEESLHGNALLSRFPMLRTHSFALPNGKDKMKGDEKRIGSQRAVIADIEHPAGMFRAVALHLDAHSSQRHRQLQMKLLLDHLDSLSPALPVLIGGDWNTTTHNASRALYSILGYFRRVMMGVRRVVRYHYPYPERWFERRLFAQLEARGYKYRDLNLPGECTLHYEMNDIAANLNMREWVPNWCFWFIRWALARTGGKCSMKLDWFAGKAVRALERRVVHDIRSGGRRVSDHDPIVLVFEV
jgi:endonuclease/exonuclease/phosphatase family metal-dependent hydrolase